MAVLFFSILFSFIVFAFIKGIYFIADGYNDNQTLMGIIYLGAAILFLIFSIVILSEHAVAYDDNLSVLEEQKRTSVYSISEVEPEYIRENKFIIKKDDFNGIYEIYIKDKGKEKINKSGTDIIFREDEEPIAALIENTERHFRKANFFDIYIWGYNKDDLVEAISIDKKILEVPASALLIDY